MMRTLFYNFRRVGELPFFWPLALFAACVVFFLPRGVNPSPDSSWYLSNAIEIYKNGLCADIFTMRRPVFPFFMAVSFHIFGPSLESGFYVVRLFWALNIFLCYFAGSRLYNRNTGAVLALLVLTSYTMNMWSSFLLLDNIIPFFILLYIFSLYVAFEKSSFLWFFAAGMAIGTAMLVKGGMAIVFVPLPLFLFIYKRYRTKRNLAGVFVLYLPLMLLPAPWVYNIVYGKAKLEVLLGPLGHLDYALAKNGLLISGGDISSGKVLDVAAKSLASLSRFIHYYIFNSFVLAFLFVLGLVYTCYEALVHKTRSAGLLLFSLLLFSPIVFFVSKAGMRQGQVVILYLLLYIMTANMLVNFPDLFASKRFSFFGGRSFTHDSLKKASILLCVLAIALQVFAGTGSKRSFASLIFSKRSANFYGFSLWRGDFESGGWFNADVRKAAQWIEENIPFGTKMICHWEYREALRFLTGHEYRIGRINPVSFILAGKIDPHACALRPVFVWYKRKKIKVQFEDDILEQINKGGVDYVIVTSRLNFYTLYFENNPCFSLEKTFGSGRIKIFKVVKKPVSPRQEFPPMFGRSLYEKLRKSYRGDTIKYERAKELLSCVLKKSDIDPSEFFGFVEKGDFEGFGKRYRLFETSNVY